MEVHRQFNSFVDKGHYGWWETSSTYTHHNFNEWEDVWPNRHHEEPHRLPRQHRVRSESPSREIALISPHKDHPEDHKRKRDPEKESKIDTQKTEDVTTTQIVEKSTSSTRYYSNSLSGRVENGVTRNTRRIYHMELHKTISVWKNDEKEHPTKVVDLQPSVKPTQIVPPTYRSYPLTLRELLLDKALNVEDLVIHESQKIHLTPNDHIYLPMIKTLSWHAADRSEYEGEEKRMSPTPTRRQQQESYQRKRQSIFKILLAAPNLTQIKDFHFDTDWDLVFAARKVYAVKKLYIYDTVSIDHLLNFVDASPKLKILQLIDTYETNDPFNPSVTSDKEAEERKRKLTLAVQKLLDSTHETLRVLNLSQFCSRIRDLKIPHKFPLLRQLTVGSISDGDPFHWKPEPSSVFPRKLRLDKYFPHLEVLDLSRLQCQENSNWDLYFPKNEKMSGLLGSVRILVVNDQCTVRWMEKIKEKLCPNFVKLVVWSGKHGGSVLNHMLQNIFRHWQHLEYLELRVEDLPSVSPAFCLDSAFTGLTVETCRRLRVYGPVGQEEDEVMMSMALVGKNAHVEMSEGTRPSIVDMKKLKVLEILLGHDCLEKLAMNSDDENNPMPLLSFVSGRCAFHKVEGLRVWIVFDEKCPWGNVIMRKKFNYLSPYVNLRHKHDDTCHRMDEYQHYDKERGRETLRISNC